MKNKKGATAWYIVALGLAVFVFVVFAVGGGDVFGKAFKKIKTYGGDEMQTVVEACQIECAKQSEYGFCKKIWKIKGGDETQEVTCKKLYFEKELGDCGNICAGVETAPEEAPPANPVATV